MLLDKGDGYTWRIQIFPTLRYSEVDRRPDTRADPRAASPVLVVLRIPSLACSSFCVHGLCLNVHASLRACMQSAHYHLYRCPSTYGRCTHLLRDLLRDLNSRTLVSRLSRPFLFYTWYLGSEGYRIKEEPCFVYLCDNGSNHQRLRASCNLRP